MKFSAILCLLIVSACGCSSRSLQERLLSEQQSLKDSANNVSARVGNYARKGVQDSADAEKAHLAAIYGRLIAIQASLDSLEKAK